MRGDVAANMRLEDLLDQSKRIIQPEKMRSFMQYTLQPSLLKDGALANEYRERGSYISEFLQSERAVQLQQRIKDGIAKAWQHIDPEKVAKASHEIRAQCELLGSTTLLAFGKGQFLQNNDSPVHPWQKALEQLGRLANALHDIIQSGVAQFDEQEASQLSDDVLGAYYELEDALKPTWYKLHLEAFEVAAFFASAPEWIETKADVEHAKHVVERVCTELKLFLQSKPQTKGKQATVRWESPNILWYRKIDHPMPKNSLYTKVCQKIYVNCRQVGDSMDMEEIHDLLRSERLNTSSAAKIKWADDMMRKANKHAIKKHKLPLLFIRESNSIKRLV